MDRPPRPRCASRPRPLRRRVPAVAAAVALGLCGLVAVGHHSPRTATTGATGPAPAAPAVGPAVVAAADTAGSAPGGGGDADRLHDPDGDRAGPGAATAAGSSDTAGGQPGGGTAPAVRIDSADTAPLLPGETGWAGLTPSPALAGVPAQPPRSLTGAEGVEPFVLIGFSWAGPVDTAARFRVHGASGWGAWRPLVRSAEHGPDPGSSERAGDPGPTATGGDATVGDAGPGADRVAPGAVATDPVWVGPSDGWQLGLDGDASAVRVHLVRTTPATGTEPVAGEAGPAAGPFGTQRTGAPGSAALPTIGPWSGVVFAPALTAGPAVAERPPILPRSQWSARPPSSATWVATSLRLAVVHHTGSGESATYTPADVPVMLRAEQAYHMDVNGWYDFGYNFVIDRFGRIWEGRDGGPAALTVGAHAEGMNTGSVGIALLGDFSAGQPSPEALDALGRLLAWKLFRHGANPARTGTMLPRVAGRFAALVPVALPRIVGHQDVNSTACPGNVEPLLPAIRADVQRRWTALAAATTVLGDAAVGPSPRGVPTAGDVDKDGDEDIIWYRPGPDRDELWRSTGEGGFVVTEFDIPDGGGAGARVTRLDWEGDGAVDVLVSTPGRTSVTLVRGVPGGTVTISSLAFSGNALPVVGDFDADGDDDVLFYRSGITTLPLAEWDGATGATVTNLTLTGGPYRPVAADVDGDLRSDVLWYGPGPTADVLWISQGGHAFGTTRSVTMAGDHRPVAADLDGDQRDDIVWTTAAGGSTPVWFGGATFTASTIDHGPTTQPTFGDIDGGGTDDVVAVAADGTATVWLRRPGAPWAVRREVVPTGAQPLLLDIDGDGRREILWWVDGGDAGLWRPI